MADTTILNAAPMTLLLGVQDLSTAQVTPVPEVLPTHFPKIYFYAQKGPLTPQNTVGDSLTQMYGVNSFDLQQKWANHATVLVNAVNAQGNSMMTQRVVPADAPPPATLRLNLDVLSTTVQDYQRNSDGSIRLDINGDPVPVSGSGGMIAGYIAKWVITQAVDNSSAPNFGEATILPGDQTANSVQSQRYPILDFAVPDAGYYGNNNGISLWAPTIQSNPPIDTRLLTNQQVYPFRIIAQSRINLQTTPQPVTTLNGDPFIDVVFQQNVIDLTDTAQISIGDVFIPAYQQTNIPGTPPVFGPFGSMFVYQNNINTLVAEFYAAEVPVIDSFSDFNNSAGEEFLFNFVSGVNSNNVPYHSFIINNSDANAARLSPTSVLYAAGGGDGTMNDTLFASLVSEQVVGYADPNSYLQDTALYPESIIYDSGFPLQTKKDLVSFIAVRKDTYVVLSCYDTTGPILDASQESSLAISLKTYLQQYPESTFYGTATYRGMIIGRSGTLVSSQYKKPLPLTIEFASKQATYMGASNGVWASAQSYEGAPGSLVQLFTNINVGFTPSTVRNQDWANGLTWVENYDRVSQYFPAFHTVYDNDTSVLTSAVTAQIMVDLQKIGIRVQRQYSGRSNLTDAQLIKAINDAVNNSVLGKYDNRVTVIPETIITAQDAQRNYSWTLIIKCYAPGLKTVETLTVQSNRIEDLTT